MDSDEFPHVCQLCERAVPKVTAHHLVPKSRGGKETVDVCPDCHGMIHVTFANKKLAESLNTIEQLQNESSFRENLNWIRKRPAARNYRAKRSRSTNRRRRRNP